MNILLKARLALAVLIPAYPSLPFPNYERLTTNGEAPISLSAAKRMFRYGIILYLAPLVPYFIFLAITGQQWAATPDWIGTAICGSGAVLWSAGSVWSMRLEKWDRWKELLHGAH